jgi:hypothetical protein
VAQVVDHLSSKQKALNSNPSTEKEREAGHWWLTPLILSILDVVIRKIMVQGQLRQTVHKTLFPK